MAAQCFLRVLSAGENKKWMGHEEPAKASLSVPFISQDFYEQHSKYALCVKSKFDEGTDAMLIEKYLISIGEAISLEE